MRVLLLVLATWAAFQANATSRDKILAFECTALSMNGTSELSYKSNPGFNVSVTRNQSLQLEYRVHSVGLVGPTLQFYGPFHFTLSGGALLKNQYLSFVASQVPTPGASSLSGSVLLVSQGGSPLQPILGGVTRVGTFTCEYFEVK